MSACPDEGDPELGGSRSQSANAPRVRRFRAIPNLQIACWLPILLVACAAPAPVVRNVTTTVAPHRCTLPPTPPPAVIVGYPNGPLTDLLVTRTDLAGLVAELRELRLWLAAVGKCVAIP